MNILSEIKFALDNGFTEIKKGFETDGSPFFSGTFGYVVVNENEAKEIENLISQYVTVEETEKEETATTQTFEEVLVNLFGSKYEVKSSQIQSLLNENIIEVRKSGKGANATYTFIVENDNNAYNLSASLTGKGRWWVKRGRSMR